MSLAIVAFVYAALEVRAMAQLARAAQRGGGARVVDLAAPPEADGARVPPADEPSALRFVIAPVISPERSSELYRDLIEHLAAAVGRKAVYLHRPSYGEVNDLLRFHLADVAMVCSYAFVRGEREWGMEALAIPEMGGRIDYRSHIVVPRGSRVRSLIDLRGRPFAFGDILSTSGWLYPATWLIDRGRDPTRHFSRIVLTGSHDRSIQTVALGYAAGAAVDSLVYEQVVAAEPDIAARIRVVQTSPPYGMPPLAVHPRLDATLKAKLREALLAVGEGPEGRALLAPLGIDRFVQPPPDLYRSVRIAAERWESYR